ncbi:hypothetical protein ER308_10185 [Egibacter rhizosphaerae]|uniref:Uncharacterized protein n=1 Tax=Egibacter rhizosphaerae TaxID=1670831 RepID=A0A411YF88_9ACTN|nr:hypothetical protein [Egibacter rhizosphaerae]QBI19890.1 hypothetical protein ER308_10185 [Egibacter rhizosphaerae]
MNARAWRSVVATELRLHRRHGVWGLTAATALAWGAVLLALPEEWRTELVPWLLLLEVAGLGFVAAPALTVVERANGLAGALRLAGLTPAVAVTVRTALLGAYALAVAIVLLLVAGEGWAPTVLGGAVGATVLLTLVAIAVVGAAETLTAYLARVPLLAALLIGPALVDGLGLFAHPLLAVSPLTGALELLGGEPSWPAATWLLAAVAVVWVIAVRRSLDPRPAAGPATGRRHRRGRIRRREPGSGWQAVRSLAAVDRATLLGDRLLLMLLAGLPLIAIATRWLSGGGVAFVAERYGLDLAPHLPAVWAFVVAIHVPVIVGSLVGLLWSEDRDAGLLPVLALTPAGLRVVAAYRLGAAMVAGALAVAAVLLLAGAAPGAGVSGLVATAAAGGVVAAVPVALVGGFARDRVQAVALLKATTVPLYLPVAWWFLDTPGAWLLGVVPTAWAAQALWASTPATAALSVLAAVATTAVALAVLVPRMVRSPAHAA